MIELLIGVQFISGDTRGKVWSAVFMLCELKEANFRPASMDNLQMQNPETVLSQSICDGAFDVWIPYSYWKGWKIVAFIKIN